LGWPPARYPVRSSRQAHSRLPITLPVRRVRLEQTPEQMQTQMYTALASRALIQGANVVVAQFEGRAGMFRYETVELIRFSQQGVTFEYLRGPFRSCFEWFNIDKQTLLSQSESSVVDATESLSHTVNFTLPCSHFHRPVHGKQAYDLAETLARGSLERKNQGRNEKNDTSMRRTPYRYWR
jgi:hypothetical protein